jgi:hypothetical protein
VGLCKLGQCEDKVIPCRRTWARRWTTAGRDHGRGDGGNRAATWHAYHAVALAGWASGGTVQVGRAQFTNTTEFPIIDCFLQLSNQFNLVKCEKGTSMVPKNSKLFML